jgi:adenosylcobalamin-dependent ribonucleoside-triphosphate reductase
MTDIITQTFLEKYKNKQPNWGFGELGYVVYKRTYSRTKENGESEEWFETVARCINGAQKIGASYTKDEAERLYDLVFNLKCNFAGRMLWQLGTSTVDRFGANSLLNCWYVSMNEPKAFTFLFENLMLGGGVGYSIRREDVHELPKVLKSVSVAHINTKDADFIVPDTREGWVKLLEYTLNSFYVNGKSFTYSTILVRGAGEKINGFGGKASGPAILVEGITKISKIFQSREGKKLRSVDVLDVCNIIGSVVVAGNVRRSAEIALGDPDDILYLRAKNWNTGDIPNWRSMSNNTIYVDDYEHIMQEVWENGYVINKKTGHANGEPYGFFNLPLSQKYGRLIDGPMKNSNIYPTDFDNVVGTNPCGEISLANYECCNLCELHLNNITDENELYDAARLLYKSQKAIASLPFIHDETTKIVHKNMRLGLGVTGVCQSLDKIKWLDACYVKLRKFDREWSKEKNYPESIKLTTIKPSGCVIPTTKIKTDKGILSFEDIFKLNEINLSEKINEMREWYECINPIKVLDKNGDYKDVNKLFVNGFGETIKLTFDDGFVVECTPNHKFLLKSGEWKSAKDITEFDVLDESFVKSRGCNVEIV